MIVKLLEIERVLVVDKVDKRYLRFGSPNSTHQSILSLSDSPYEVDRIVREDSDALVINQKFATACYPEHGLPLLLYFAKAHNMDVETALLANANAGGDNVHRGMVLGVLVGACNKKLPEHLKRGLVAFDELQTEIEAFSDIASSGNAI
jgi:hypothetical protein